MGTALTWIPPFEEATGEWAGGPLHYAAYVAERSIPVAGVQADDLILHVSYSRKRDLSTVRGYLQQVPRSSFTALATADALLWVEGSGKEDDLRRYLTNRSALRAADHTSPLYILRSLVSPVSEPIQSSTDDAAIFELLYQVGGLMPSEVAHA